MSLRSLLFVPLLAAASAGPCEGGGCVAEDGEDIALIQFRGSGPAHVQCTYSSTMCSGNQCCPGAAETGGKTYNCPSASADFDGCALKPGSNAQATTDEETTAQETTEQETTEEESTAKESTEAKADTEESLFTKIHTFGLKPELTACAFVKYPGSTTTLAVQGVVDAYEVHLTHSVALTWELEDVDSRCLEGAADDIKNGCGIHIHEGLTCGDAGEVGGHYYNKDRTSDDPWLPVKYVATGSTSKGWAVVEMGYEFFSAEERSMVVHDFDGGRVACAILRSTQQH